MSTEATTATTATTTPATTATTTTTTTTTTAAAATTTTTTTTTSTTTTPVVAKPAFTFTAFKPAGTTTSTTTTLPPMFGAPSAKPAATVAAAAAAAKDEEDEPDAGDEPHQSDDSAGPHFEPLVSLPLAEVKHGEEDEDVLFKMRAKLYRFDKGVKEWKERGLGNVRFLKHKQTGKIRLLMRREKTLKICANHTVVPGPKLEPNAGSDRSWVWTCPADLSDGAPQMELFAMRFSTAEDANAFKKQYEDAQKHNAPLVANEQKSPAKEKPAEQK